MTNPEPTPPTVNSYRGGSVDVDVRRIARVGLVILLVGVTVLAVVLIVAGVHSNNQTNRLRNDGVPVTVTVTGCLGLLGGSGSNAAGDACQGEAQAASPQGPSAGTGLFGGVGALLGGGGQGGDGMADKPVFAFVEELQKMDVEPASDGLFVPPPSYKLVAVPN